MRLACPPPPPILRGGAALRVASRLHGRRLRPHPGGECLDRIDDGFEADGVEEVECVVSPGQLRVDHRARGVAPQPRNEVAGVFNPHQRVQVAVREEEGRRRRCPVTRRPRPEQPAAGVKGAVVAVQADRGGNRGVCIVERGLLGRHVGCDCSDRSQVSAGGAARYQDDSRVGAVLGTALAHPGEHLLGVRSADPTGSPSVVGGSSR
jgi:hypothetical protein